MSGIKFKGYETNFIHATIYSLLNLLYTRFTCYQIQSFDFLLWMNILQSLIGIIFHR